MDRQLLSLLVVISLTGIGLTIMVKDIPTAPKFNYAPVENIHRIKIESPSATNKTKVETNSVELYLPDNIKYIKGSSFIADVLIEDTDVEIGDQIVIIMLKKDI